MKVVIYKSDAPIIIARKIFNHFMVNQSCTIEGFTERTDIAEPIGRVVWNFIREMDYDENYVIEKGRKPRRKYREPPKDAVGGRYAHKIFRHKHVMRENQLVTIIWRVQ